MKCRQHFYGADHLTLILDHHFRKIPCSVYISTLMIGSTGFRIFGWCRHSVVAKIQPERKPRLYNRCVPLSSLEDFETLLSALDRASL